MRDEAYSRNPYARMQPSQRMLALARADGIDSSNRAAYDAWLADKRKEKK